MSLLAHTRFKSEALRSTYIGEPEPTKLVRATYCDPALQRADMWHSIAITSRLRARRTMRNTRRKVSTNGVTSQLII